MSARLGREILLSLGGTTVNGTTNHSFDKSISTIPVTTKDSEDNAEEFMAVKSESAINMEGVLDEADAYGFEELNNAADAMAAIAFVLFGDTVGQLKLTGNAIITNLHFDAPMDEKVTWTCALKVTGKVTMSTVA